MPGTSAVVIIETSAKIRPQRKMNGTVSSRSGESTRPNRATTIMIVRP